MAPTAVTFHSSAEARPGMRWMLEYASDVAGKGEPVTGDERLLWAHGSHTLARPLDLDEEDAFQATQARLGHAATGKRALVADEHLDRELARVAAQSLARGASLRQQARRCEGEEDESSDRGEADLADLGEAERTGSGVFGQSLIGIDDARDEKLRPTRSGHGSSRRDLARSRESQPPRRRLRASGYLRRLQPSGRSRSCSNPAPLTVAALYVLAAGAEATGVLERIASWNSLPLRLLPGRHVMPCPVQA